MLNISNNSISDHVELKDFKSHQLLLRNKITRLSVWFIVLLITLIVISPFLPWTQNILTKGYVTTRSPQQRPQAIQAVIPGRLEKWYVQEGDYVNSGDTIVYMTEVKSEYLDPNLIDRTSEQVNAKALSIDAYSNKITALNKQYDALEDGLRLKLLQTKNKVSQGYNKIKIDSIDLAAVENNYEITKNQLLRVKELYGKGLKSLTELQEKEYKLQAELAKVNIQKNKLINQKNELHNLQLELLTVEREYADKLSKSLSDKQSAISSKMEGVAEVSKLKNQLSNYTERKKFYYVTAPQSGYITKTIKKGLGETIKEGTDIAIIVPSTYDIALELYVKPQDIPLLEFGNRVNIRFDGWPAIVMSGWPEAAVGVFEGKIVAIDRFISENGNYRILVSPLNGKKPWPTKLSIGTGAQAFIFLNQVPLWYELWRQLNGFPPDFYKDKDEKNENVKRKAPIKSIK
jgi:adhesin transport system membrane fusion protein